MPHAASDPIELFTQFLAVNDCEPFSEMEITADDAPHYYRLAVDKPGQKRGSYCLKIEDDGFAVGWAYNHKTGDKYSYVGKVDKKFTDEEKAAFKIKAAEARKLREATELLRHMEVAKEAKARWDAAKPISDHAYLAAKKVKSHGLREEKGSLLIPMYIDSKICGLQSIDKDGDKLFMTDARKKGAYFPLVNKEELAAAGAVILFGEGYATCATIREVTGMPVVCCFDAGNLVLVAAAFRKKYPDLKFVFCADNDIFTVVKGLPHNTGVIKANLAREEVGNALVVRPEFSVELIDRIAPEKPTDFNDAFVHIGAEYIKNRIAGALVPVMDPPSDFLPVKMDDLQLAGGLPAVIGRERRDEPFKILGHNEGIYYFLPKAGGQIVGLTMPSMSNIVNLFRLAVLEFWEYGCEEISHKKLATFKANELSQRAHKIGIFKPIHIRGVGAWIDNDKKVMHCGGQLVVGDDKINPYEFKSKYVYPMAETLVEISDDMLGNKDANRLREICAKLSWENKLSGDLLAGWCVIAPICAALKWRPHLWITGTFNSGKTTIKEKIIAPVVGDLAIKFEGGTTEAAIRQRLGYSGRPVMMDEAEAETQKDKSIMENILQLARRSSSGGSISKGTAGGEGIEYTIRSAFCFFGINPMIKHRADESRISQLVLRKSELPDAGKFYAELEREIKKTLTPDFGRKLLNRTFKYLDVILDNCDIFVEAAAAAFSDRRAADQIGPMLAGLFSLTSTKRIEYDQAIEWIKQHDWKMHTAIDEENDSERLIMYILSKFIKLPTGKEDTIGNLIKKVHRDNDEASSEILRKYGIWVRDEAVWFANKSTNLEIVLKETVWFNWKRPLMDIPGAKRQDPVNFAPGIKQRSISIPYKALNIDDDVELPEEMEQELYYGSY
jgi:putative DNA primase/helicase